MTSVYTVVGAINEGLTLATLFTSLKGGRPAMAKFYKSIVVHAKTGQVSPTTPLWDYLSSVRLCQI